MALISKVFLFFQMPEVGAYCMSKAAMDMFTQCLALGKTYKILNLSPFKQTF